MLTSALQLGRYALVCLLVVIFALQTPLQAQTHIVNPGELHKEAVAATVNRQQNVKTLTEFFSTSTAQKGLRSAQMDPRQVTTAVATLSDADLAQLASRAQTTQMDFAAGRLSDRDLLIILLGIAALVLIIVAVR